MGIKRINQDLCLTNCGICVDECPFDVFAIDAATGKAMVRYPEDCHECYYLFLCEKACPVKGAIETEVVNAQKYWFAVD